MPQSEKVWSIVVAAGSGLRFGGAKQFTRIGARRVVDWAVEEAERHSLGVVVVVPPGHTGEVNSERTVFVEGGATRSESVRRGLAAVPEEATIICVHDAARPFAPETVWHRVVGAIVDGADGAVPGVPVTDTIKQVANDAQGRPVVIDTPDRSTLVAVQTPQAFRADVLRAAHSSAAVATDDAALVEAMGSAVVVIEGEPTNLKITGPDDLVLARVLLDRLG